MDGRGRCENKIFIERLWRSLKYEENYLHELTDGIKTERVIGEWIGIIYRWRIAYLRIHAIGSNGKGRPYGRMSSLWLLWTRTPALPTSLNHVRFTPESGEGGWINVCF